MARIRPGQRAVRMSRYRCSWCGRFYSSPLPEDSACDNHIPEHNAQLAASIARHNWRIQQSLGVDGGSLTQPETDKPANHDPQTLLSTPVAGERGGEKT